MAASPVHSDLRRLRTERGWSQDRTAQFAGISRQSYSSIESGRSVPSTEIALRLARAFERPVESLFRLADDTPSLIGALPAGIGAPPTGRVRLARMGNRVLAYGLEAGGAHAGALADGVVEDTGKALTVHPFPDRPAPPDLIVAGCDPAFGLVARILEDRGVHVLWIPAGSGAALQALARGAIHVAGVHLRDEATGEYNEPAVRRVVPFPTVRIGFSVWEQSLVCAPGNPLGIGGVEDLDRSGLRLLNREEGSGARALLDEQLRRAGHDPERIQGYHETSATGHQEVVGTIAAGAADVGVAIRAAALARGLVALPLAREPYELVLPEGLIDTPPVTALLSALRSPALRRQVEALGGYDGEPMGRVA